MMKAKLSVIDISPTAEHPVCEYVDTQLDCLASKDFLPELRELVSHASEHNHVLQLELQDETMDALSPTVPSIEEIAAQLRDIVERAQAALGKNLGGGSMTDLCCDNTKYSIEIIRVAMTVAGLNWEVRNV